MKVSTRDVISQRGFTFKDTGKKDPKDYRDCLVLAENESRCFYVTLTTNNKKVWALYKKNKKMFHILNKDNCEGLRETSLVNLQNIYVGVPSGRLVAIVSANEHLRILEKLRWWQEKESPNPDEYYEELKQAI